MAGRRKKVTEKVIERVLASIRVGNTEKFNCMRAGISYEAFRQWRNKSPKHEERAQEALEEWCNALLTKIDEHGKKNPNALMWRLERMFPQRFARPEVMLQLNQQFGDAQKAAQASIWMEPAGKPAQAFAELEFSDCDWEKPDYQPVAALPAPSPQVADPAPDPSSLSPRAREAKMRKHYASTPGQPVEVEAEAEVVDMSGNPKLRLPDNQLTQIEKLQRYGSGNQLQGRVTAAKPTPPPSPGFNAFGEREMLND